MLRTGNMTRERRSILILGAPLMAMGLLTSCSPPPPVEIPAAPPPQTGVDKNDTTKTPDIQSGLLGGATAGPETGSSTNPNLLQFRRPDGVLVVAMKPVANPGEASKGQGAVSKTRMVPEHLAHAAPQHTTKKASHTAAPVKPAQTRHASGKPASAAPVAKAKPVAVKPKAVKPKAVKPVIQPVAPPKVVVPPERPATKRALPSFSLPKFLTPGSAVTADASQTVLAIPALSSTDPRLGGLQSDILPDLTAGARFVIGEGVIKGQAGPVTLTLPKTLLARVRANAARHGLDRFTQQASVTAILTGTGYEVIPASPQARELSSDRDTVFTWQVTPQPVKRAPLHADLTASLVGGPAPLTLPLAGLEPSGKTASGRSVDMSGRKPFTLPGLSASASRSVAGAAFLMIALALIAFAARRVSEGQRREERRRRQRDAMMFSTPMPDLTPEPTTRWTAERDETPPVTTHDLVPEPVTVPEPVSTATVTTVDVTGTAPEDERSMVQVIAEAVSDLRDAEGKEPRAT